MNALSFRPIKGQSHHSAGTRNISLGRKHYHLTQTTWYPHHAVADWVSLQGQVGKTANDL